jgi:3-oxoacyl-[acyl-carrier protein] reductase
VGVFEGKGALVTGGSRGIGRAIVQRLAGDGAVVVFSFVENEAAAESVVSEVEDDGGRAFAVRADQGRMEDLRKLFDEAEQQLDGLDIVVSNASINPAVAILDATEDEFERVMAVNAKGPFFIMQYAGEKLRDGGRIINISTLNTAVHAPSGALYVGSKGAVEQFTVVAAHEFGRRGITVNCVSPGATDTELLRSSNPGATFEDTLEWTAQHRLGEPADIASVVAFLAGPDSQWITGQNLRATGGLYI